MVCCSLLNVFLVVFRVCFHLLILILLERIAFVLFVLYWIFGKVVGAIFAVLRRPKAVP